MRIRKRTVTETAPTPDPEHEIEERAARGIFGITTAQLGFLWFGGLGIAAALLMVPSPLSIWHVVAAVAMVTALGMYTTSPAIKARKDWVLLAVLGAALLVTVFHLVGRRGYIEWRDAAAERRAASLVRLEEVEIADLRVEARNPRTLAGTIRNHSAHTLASVTLGFTATSFDGDVVERGTVTIHKVVPPGEVRRFPPVDKGHRVVPLEGDTVSSVAEWNYRSPDGSASPLLVPVGRTGGTGLNFSWYDVEVSLRGTRGR